MGILDIIEDHRAAFWGFVAVFILLCVTSLLKGSGPAGALEAGIIGGMIGALLLTFGKRIVQR